MTNNPFALKARDLITDVLIDITVLLGSTPNNDPNFRTIQATQRELSQLNFQIVVDDINQMAATINQHNDELKKLTSQIQQTTASLEGLAKRLEQVSKVVEFLVSVGGQAAALGLV
ncbi:hypothetical protein GCM10023189_06830 [Nibrella saemangeumensis]|uniref:P10 n=1 Tax=Nibrella saemangeumensis TaxID=1084526 RepID=A0ABP8MFN0_9BACT